MSAGTKVLDREELLARLAPLREQGRTVALANGLFDLLHVGHLRYLEGSAGEADLLVVAVNSDDSARRLKGAGRPIVAEDERAELVAGFACVDYVTVFSEPDVGALLHAVLPDVHCKGTDYTPESVPEAGIAASLGIRVAIVGDPKRHATRDIIKLVRGK